MNGLNAIFWLVIFPVGLLFWGIVIIFLILLGFAVFGKKQEDNNERD